MKRGSDQPFQVAGGDDGDARAGWRRHASAAVGGLWCVGFAAGTEHLLVLSVNGRGVFDGATGLRVARDPDPDADGYDEATETAAGLGPIVGIRVGVAGDGGGIWTRRRLPRVTIDGWSTHADAGARATLLAPDRTIYASVPVEDVRACGFSGSGRTWVVAEQHTLHLWTRSGERSA